MKAFKSTSQMSQDERYFRDRCYIQTYAIESVEAVSSFTGLTEEEFRSELMKITKEYRERLSDLHRTMMVSKIAE